MRNQKINCCSLPHATVIVVSVLCLFACIPPIKAFNLDTVNYIRHEGEPDSMFGFSVALHKEQQRSWVIIGAPRADTSRIQSRVFRGGAVYRCDIFDDNRCHLIPFDSAGNQYNERNEQIDTKSDQWFGATVSSAGIDGPLVACAPRYVFHTMQPRKVVRVEPVGTCYMAKNNFQEYTEYSPCRTMFWGYHKQGSCQAGLSAALTKNGDRLFIGAPGSWYWQGQEYSINTDATYPYKPPRYGQYGEGQTYSFSLNNPKDKVWSTRESTAAEDDSYLGYSSVTGDFNGDGTQGVAVGMPRGGGLLGKVLIFSWNMTNQQNITGEQIGAYFGYSLCVVDVDGDKLEDLIIGAPMHTEPNNEGKFEMGRVYIIYQDKFNKFQTLDTRDGINSRARFGLSLTSLGDINLDGYGDFAVGAPYDGPHGRGAVYIYHGSKNGPLPKASQVIFAEDVAGTGYLSTFGFSVSGGIDLDGNMYPDLVVGAYEANKAIVFKSRPVAVVEATTTFDIDSKLVSLDDKKCTTVRDRKQVTCTAINSCLKYNGINLPATIDIDVSWVLDAKKSRNPRLFFLNEEGKNIRNSTMRLNRGKTECRTERVYISDNIRDKLTPLEVEMRFNMRDANQVAQQRVRRATLEPVIDQNRGTIERDSINIQKNCGPDNICIPDLRLEIHTVDKYLLGSKDLLVFEVKVSNFGEDAFEAGFFMTVPPGLNFRKIERIGDVRDTPITCTAPSPATNHTLRCDIGNPLSSGKIANFKVILLPTTKNGIAPKYDFYLEANSTNAEVEGTEFDNVVKKTVGISVETNLSVKGVSIDEEILYNTTDFVSLENATRESQIGPQVVHIYEIRNGGPSTIEQAEIYFLWPHESISNDPLLYLLNQPESTRNVHCEPTSYANVRNLELDRSLVAKSFLVSQGAIEKSSLHSAGGRYSSSSSSFSSSSSASSGHAAGGGKAHFSEEEKRRFDEEENRESTGDASYIHRQRAHQAAQEQSGIESGKNYEHSASSSWSASSQNGKPAITYSASQNRTAVRGGDGRVYVAEYSTEHYGNVADAQINRAGIGHSSHPSSQQYHNQGANANVHRAGSFGLGGTSDIRKVEDFPSEGSVSQDISGLQARTQTQSQMQSQAQSQASSTGRRRMMSQQDGEPPRPDLITGVSQLDKIGQGGSGFQVGTMELNTLARDNVDEEIRQHGNAAHLAAAAERQQQHNVGGGGSSASASSSNYGGGSSGNSYQGHSGGYQASSSGTQHFSSGSKQSSSAGNANAGVNNEEYDDEYDHEDEYYEDVSDKQQHQTQGQSQQQQQQQYHRSQSTLGANNGIVDQRFKHYHRLRRNLPDFNDLELKNRLSCNRSQCALIRCITGQLDTDSSAWIAFRMRLVTQTVNAMAPNVPLNISTMVVSRIARLPYIGEPHEKPLVEHEVKITAIPIPEPKPDIVPLWIIVLSACVGVIILLLLIYLLYKCGFFKRNRPDTSQERQPLNRNNGYHGDERL